MGSRALHIAIWICNLILLGMAILLTFWAFSYQPTWVQNLFLAWTLFVVGYTLVQRLRFVRRRKALQKKAD